AECRIGKFVPLCSGEAVVGVCGHGFSCFGFMRGYANSRPACLPPPTCGGIRGLPDDRGDDAAARGAVAELAEINPLPGAEVEPAAGDGNGEFDARERRFGMCGHVVVAFERMG